MIEFGEPRGRIMLSLATVLSNYHPDSSSSTTPGSVLPQIAHETVSTLSTCAAGIWDLVSIVESDDAGDTRRPRNILMFDLMES